MVPIQTDKLLACQIIEDLTWKHHILLSDESVIKQLTSRVNGLCLISDRSTFETRLMVANGIILSKLCYLIQLWGGCEKYLIQALQIIQNRAARVVTGKSWFTPVRRLLKDCRWLSVQQLIFYHTVLQTHKVVLHGDPVYFKQRMSTQHPRDTRQAAGGSVWRGDDYTGKSFSARGAQAYNNIPSSIRSCCNLLTFKSKLRKWVELNIPIS